MQLSVDSAKKIMKCLEFNAHFVLYQSEGIENSYRLEEKLLTTPILKTTTENMTNFNVPLNHFVYILQLFF